MNAALILNLNQVTWPQLDGKLMVDAESGELWGFFGGFSPLPRQTGNEENKAPDYDGYETKLYRVEKGQAELVETQSLAKELLGTDTCYILDCGPQVFIWIGNKFIFWYTRRTSGMRAHTSYEDNIKKIVEFNTVEGFWTCYCHLAHPTTLPVPTDLHLFKEGICPLWEDVTNCNGGKWIIRFKKAVSGRFWEDLVLALVGDQLEFSEDVCGAVLSVCFSEDILSVWNHNASNH